MIFSAVVSCENIPVDWKKEREFIARSKHLVIWRSSCSIQPHTVKKSLLYHLCMWFFVSVCAEQFKYVWVHSLFFVCVCIYNGDIFNLFATLFITEPADHMAVLLSRRWITPETAESKPVCDLCGTRPPSCEAPSPSCGPSLTGESCLQPEPSFQTHHHLSLLEIKAQWVTWVTHPDRIVLGNVMLDCPSD